MTDHFACSDSPAALVERMRCPSCGGDLCFDGLSAVACTICGEQFGRRDGIWRMLTQQQRIRYAPFLDSYPLQRSREGWERDAGYYLGLPQVASDDPTAKIWRIRRRSLCVLERQLLSHFGDNNTGWALDLGAGNCWLSRRIAKFGFCTVSVDLNVEGSDSLSTGRLFIEHDNLRLERVQASMDSLPFGDQMIDLCTVSAALYYADVQTTLHEVYRVLRPRGALIITDSPVYSHVSAGVEMAMEQRLRLARLLGQEPADLPGGRGFLVQTELDSQLRQAGFSVSIISVEHPLGRARRRIRRFLRCQKREEARFPVFVAIKPTE